MTAQPITIAVVNDYEVVVRGVAAMLAPFDDRVRVIESTAGGDPDVAADIALFDTFAGRRLSLSRAAEMVSRGVVRHVVLYTWDATPAFIEQAAKIGVAGVVLKTRSSEALVEALERVARGERVGFDAKGSSRSTPLLVELSARESEVLALIARGLTNAQMAEELYLSSETVKTYVKRLYAKLGVHNRAQAAVAAGHYHLAPRV
jgi:DNA-binding NarL/FixJ family response regulator